jgi:hypothetical protein
VERRGVRRKGGEGEGTPTVLACGRWQWAAREEGGEGDECRRERSCWGWRD